jgi:hypothetical protein
MSFFRALAGQVSDAEHRIAHAFAKWWALALALAINGNALSLPQSNLQVRD